MYIICNNTLISHVESIGKTNEAIQNYEVAMNTTDPSSFIHKCIGRCHENLGNIYLAKKFYLKSIQLEPSNENSWESLILFFINQKKYKKAEYYLNRALEINSDSTNLWKKSLELNALNGKQERVRISSNRLVELGNSKLDIFNITSVIFFWLCEKNKMSFNFYSSTLFCLDLKIVN